MKKISKIVLTGGPCAGKTTGMSWIIDNFTKRGYKVLVVAETATELIEGGAYPWEVISSVEFQVALYKMLKEKEATYEAIARNLQAEKVLIVCDRGALDAEAYLTSEQIQEFHDQVALGSLQMMEDYDAVFHLVTAAKGAVEYYTTENNESRKETPEQAAELDDKTIAAWTGHPHLRIIDNSTQFEKKMLRLVTEISSFLGEPEPFEIEKKFLIERPDISMLESLPNCQRVEILQTYLLGSSEEEETRVRQRGDGKSFLFTKTSKRVVTEQKRVEVEKKLTMSEYCMEIMNADTRLRPIRKTRYCLSYNDSYLEIDVYPDHIEQLHGRCILEVELPSEDAGYSIPDFIHVIEDVTENRLYKNHTLAGGTA
ncbi:hypothetical protein DXB08_23825 [Hungatella hathewayi]|uniref:AAA family ATPase n=1 Tax=Hungatella hathewayi TaxID=154046 RepID=UPI000E43C59C|nr:AAA family ATPase [Hungatella hathewayi]RGO68111.1 hypothetical protein DXB08_23825 [Hungatella hathewayi]